jgi:prepilin-type N-terminal cleavage/methylation domain-containing protein
MALSTHNSKRRGFTLVELLVVIAIIGMLLGLLLPAVQSARESARRTQCSVNIRSLAQATDQYESARLKMPAAMDRWMGSNGSASVAGASGTNGAYSSIFMLLPYLEEKTVYDNVSNNTGRLTQGPFSVGTTAGAASGGAYSAPLPNGLPHAATLTNIAVLQCPTSSVGSSVNPVLFFNGVSTGNTASDVQVTPSGGSLTPCGRTAYHAMVGAFMVSGSVPIQAAGAIVLQPPATTAAFGLAGIQKGQVSDGLTKTILFVESREQTYASWIDGATTWVTAQAGSSDLTATSAPVNGKWVVTSSALNQSGYMTAAQAGSRFANSRDWGPSSEHPGGIVFAAFGDTHVQPITNDVDPSVFTAWSTRGGNEANGGVTQ